MQVNELPSYVKNKPGDGRVVWLCTFYDHVNKKWECYFPKDDGQLLKMNIINMAEGQYLSTSPERQDDYLNPFSTLLFQHLSFDALIPVHDSLTSDLSNSLAYIHNYLIVVDHANRYNDFRSTMVISNLIESVLTNHRSFYDLLNRTVSAFVSYTEIKGVNLPDSFRRVAQKPNSDLAEQYKFTPALIDFYKQKESQFMLLTKIRDNIVHHGHSQDIIFKLNNGFGISLDMGLLSELAELGIWKTETLEKNNIGSILCLLSFLTLDMFMALEKLAHAIVTSCKGLPVAVSPGISIFTRSDLMFHYHSSKDYLLDPWRNPEEIFNKC